MAVKDRTPQEIAAEMTVPDLYRRVTTNSAMAKSEVWALKGYLQRRRDTLQAEIEEIDKILLTASKHTDSWYDQLMAERDSLNP